MANINETLIPIPGRLHSVATEGHVAGSNEIYDDTLAKDQATINSEVNTALGTGGTIDSRIAAAKAEIIGDASSDYNTLGKVEGKVENIADNVAYIDDSSSSPAVVPSFDPESQTVHVTAQTLSEQQKAQVRDNIGLGDVDAKINEAVASEASQRAAAVSGVQASVNAEASRAQAAEADRYTKSETYSKTELNNMITTPNQQYVTVATYASLPASGSEDTIYRVSNYDGSQSQVAADVYSEYAWDGTQYIFLCVKSAVGEVFDISAYHNNAKYADLNAALTSNTGGVPQSLQKGGMSVKFVQSSDNKYVQYRLMTDEWSTDTDDWAISEEGVYVENPEFVSAKTDSDGKLIESTDTKGNKTVYGNLNVKGDIYNSTLKQINDTVKNKVDKEEGKILVDENIADNFEEEENPEYVKILTDADNKVIDSIDNQGVITHNSKHVFNNGIKDTTGKINEDVFNYVIDKSSDLARVLREKGDMVSSTDWSDSKSLEIPEPRCAYINITSSDGTAATWPTTKTANKKYWMQFWDMQGNYFKKRIIFNAQGNSSMAYIKKNGAIDICNDEWEGDDTFKVKFGNWLAFDSFHLKAYYTDFFKGVSVMAYKLADEVELSRDVLTNRPWKRQLLANYTFGTDQTNSAQVNDLSLQLDNEAKCHPDAFPCIVYLDNEFYGIYAFCIKKHRDNYHMDKGTAEHIHLDGDLYADNIWNGNINWSAFEIRNPKNLYYKEPHNGTYKYDADVAQAEIAGDEEVTAWIAAGQLPDGTKISSKIEKCLKITAKVKNYIIRLSNALATIKAETDTAKQKTLFESYFDAPSLVDYEIVQLATGDTDGFGKNWQWITLDGNHWSVCEYDKDMAFGGYFTGQFTQVAPTKGGWAGNSNSTPMGLAISLYKDDIVSMWKELTNNKILTSDNIISIADDWVNRIGTDNYKKEYKKWDEAPCCRASLVDTEHWKRTNEWKSGVENNTYDNTKTYAVGDTCYYGFGLSCKFIATAETTGNPPLTGHYDNHPKELGYYDSFWRLTNYIKQRISVENDFINSL